MSRPFFDPSHRDIRLLLDRYFAGEVHGELIEVVQGWLLAERGAASRAAKEAWLRGRFNACLDRKWPRYDRRELERLWEELGFTCRTIALPARRRTLRYLAAAVAAAAVAAIAILSPGLFTSTSQTPAPTYVRLTVPGDTTITFPDLSQAELKGGSTIAYTDNFTENRSLILAGEAFFRIARDERHPLTIEAGEARVRVLGTEFHLRAYAHEPYTEVVLASGSVEVSVAEQAVVLSPAEGARVDRASRAILRETKSEGEMLRIQGAALSLHDVSLAGALATIADYYLTPIRVASPLSGTQGIVLNMEPGATLEQTLLMLQQIDPVFDFSVGEREVIITKR